MRVCLVSPEYPPSIGGVGDYTDHLANALAARGLDVMVLTSRLPAGSGPAPPRVVDVHASVSRWGFGLYRHLRTVIAERRPDLIHIQYQTAAYGMHPAVNLVPWWLARRRPGTGCVTTMHDLREPYLFPKALPLRRAVTDLIMRSSHAVVTTNDDDAAEVRARFGPATGREQAAGPRLELIPMGPTVPPAPPDSAGAARFRREWGVPEGSHIVGHFGLVNRSKSLGALLQSVRLLLNDGVPLVLVMLGEQEGSSDPTNRGYRDEVLRLAGDLGLEAHIRWTGPLAPAEIAGGLAVLDCCVLPYSDGASYRRSSLITALAHGSAIVTTRRAVPAGESCLPPIRDGEHCLVVPAADAEALATAVRRVLTDAPLRARLSAGALTLSQHFTWPAAAARTLDLYQEVCTVLTGRPS